MSLLHFPFVPGFDIPVGLGDLYQRLSRKAIHVRLLPAGSTSPEGTTCNVFRPEWMSEGMLAFGSAGPAGNQRTVLLHGWPLDRTIWSEVAGPLVVAEQCVLYPDLPGFGDSPSLAEGHWTVEAYADEVATLLRHLGSEPVALAGHSFGGYVALALAERHPDLVAGLGLVSSRTIADSEAQRKGRHEAIAKVLARGSRVLLPDLARKLLAPAASQPLLDRATRIL